MIKTEKLPNLERATLDVPIPKPRPVPDGMPHLPMLQLIQGASGTGKTTALIDQLLKYDRARSIDFLYFWSPTFHTDPKYALLDNGSHHWKLKVHDQFDEAELARTIDTIKTRHAEYKEYLEYRDAYRKFVRTRNPDKLTPDELILLDSQGFEPPHPPEGCSPDWPPQSVIVFDDCAGEDKLYRNNSRGVLGKFTILARHYGCSLIFLLQVFRGGLGRQLRNNIHSVILFRNRSAAMRSNFAEEFSCHVDADTFVKLWEHATQDLHDFLFVDVRDPKRMFRRCWDEVLHVPGIT
jgi:hypothetical protein